MKDYITPLGLIIHTVVPPPEKGKLHVTQIFLTDVHCWWNLVFHMCTLWSRTSCVDPCYKCEWTLSSRIHFCGMHQRHSRQQNVCFFFISVQQSTCVNASLFTCIEQTPEPSLHPASLHNVATASCRKIPPFSIALWIIKVVAIPYGKEFSLLPIVNNKISGSVRPGNGHQTLGVQSCSQNNIINRLTQTFQGHCGQIVKVKGRVKIFRDIYWISVVNCAVCVACKKTICSFVFINDDWTSYSPNVSHLHLKYFEVLVS